MAFPDLALIGTNQPSVYGAHRVGGSYRYVGTYVNTGKWFIIEWRYDGTRMHIQRQDGADQTATESNVDGASYNLAVGKTYGASYFNGDIAEIVLYDTALSDTDRTTVKSYLSAKYDIPVATAAAPIPTNGLTLWLDASAMTNVCVDNVLLPRWENSAPPPGGRSAVSAESTVTLRPRYKANVVNGLPAVRFDGADDKLVSSDNISDYITPSNYTCFAVFNPQQPTVDYSAGVYLGNAVLGDPYNGAWALALRGTNQPAVYGVHHDGSAYRNVGTLVRTGSWALIEWRYDGTRIHVQRQKGGDQTRTAANLGAAVGVLNVGVTYGANYFSGDMAEIIVYKTALSDADRAAVKSYLSAKYNITVAPPSAAIPTNGLTLWLNAGDMASVCHDSAIVPLWEDSASLVPDLAFSTATAGQAPRFMANVVNGQPAVRFDGVSDYLASSAKLNQYVSQTQFTWFVVFNVAGVDYPGGPVSYEADAIIGEQNGECVLYAVTNSYRAAFTVYSAAPAFTTVYNPISTGAWQFVVAQLDGVNLAMHRYGEADQTTPCLSINGGSLDRFMYLGRGYTGRSGNEFEGDVAEVLMYNYSLSPADRTTVETYLYDKYFALPSQGTLIMLD